MPVAASKKFCLFLLAPLKHADLRACAVHVDTLHFVGQFSFCGWIGEIPFWRRHRKWQNGTIPMIDMCQIIVPMVF